MSDIDSGAFFAQTLEKIGYGDAAAQASELLADLVKAVGEHDRQGTLTLTITVKPRGKASGPVEVTANTTVKRTVRELRGIPCIGLNGGPAFKHTEAFSFQIATEDQAETDRYWNAILANGGQESECGWCKDRWGISWQITPRVLMEALAAGGDQAKRAFAAMMTMRKIDVAAIEAARRG